MLQIEKKFFHIKALVILIVAMSLAACSNGTENTNSSTDSASPISSAPASSSSPQTASSSQTTNSPTGVSIPGISNIREIKFETTKDAKSGFFDGINGSSKTKIEVGKAIPLTAGGWAIIVSESKPADMVLITYGNSNTLVATAPVDLVRSDVAKTLKNTAYSKSGWTATFNSSVLPASPVVIKAWAYNAASKEAIELYPTHEVTVLK